MKIIKITKSKCIKLYCECYANGMLCTELCNCRNCYNNKHKTNNSKYIQNSEPTDQVKK